MTDGEAQGLEGVVAFAHQRSPSPIERAARFATAASTSRSSSATCRSSRSGDCSSTSRSSRACRRPSRTTASGLHRRPRLPTCRRRRAALGGEWRLGKLIDIADVEATEDLRRLSATTISVVAQSARVADGHADPCRARDDRQRQIGRRAVPARVARRS